MESVDWGTGPELDLVTVFASTAQSSYAPRPYFTDYLLNAYMG